MDVFLLSPCQCYQSCAFVVLVMEDGVGGLVNISAIFVKDGNVENGDLSVRLPG